MTANQAELVVIDTLSAIVQAGNKRDVFRSDYNEVNTIRQLAEKHKTAILVVTHLRKMGAEYSVDAVAGTTGLTAACDAIWVLHRQTDGSSLLEVTCREMEEKTYGLKFESAELHQMPRLYLPAGSDRTAAEHWRREGWATVAGLAAVDDVAAEAKRLHCSHRLEGEKIVAVG